ncbi:MAG TPA: thiamine diphosphokinase [Acidimicrobiales bacterium]
MTGAVIVVAGGGPPAPGVAARLPVGARVIAADSGLEHAARLGLTAEVVIGDMDSVAPAALEAAAAAGVRVERHPAAKDATDLELALDAALALRPAHLAVVSGGDPSRLDHVLAFALLLAEHRFATTSVEAWLGSTHLTVIGAGRTAQLAGRAGDLVTLLPLHGAAVGVTTSGLLYPLDDEDLPPGTTRGVSNEMLAEVATVALRGGVLVAVQPGGPDGTTDPLAGEIPE